MNAQDRSRTLFASLPASLLATVLASLLATTIVAVAFDAAASQTAAAMGTAIPLDRIAVVATDAHDHLRIRGAIRSRFDGSTFTATHSNGGPASLGDEGFFDLAAGGLRVVRDQDQGADVELAPNGPGPACTAAGVRSPCLVPRLDALAHARLLSRAEMLATLEGEFQVAAFAAAPPAPTFAPRGPMLARGIALLATLAALFAGLRAFVAHRKRLIVSVRRATARARRAIGADVMMAPLGPRIEALAERADRLAAARDKAAARLARIDVRALVRRRDRYALDGSPEALAVVAWIDAERREAALLSADVARCDAGLEQIVSALAVIELRAGAERPEGADRVLAEVGRELGSRDAALAEVEWAVGRPT